MQVLDIKTTTKFDTGLEDVLKELETTQKDFWNLDRNCANFLYSLIIMKQAKNVLEIGTSNGYSGLWILKALEITKGNFTTIEFWEKRQSAARNYFTSLFPDSKPDCRIGQAIIALEDLYDEIQKGKKQSFDFVFIDANKKEYIKYFELVDKILAPDGVILADNILTHYEKVTPYVENLFNRDDYTSQILDLGAGMMLSVRLQ